MNYQVEIVWNREFHFVPHGPLFSSRKKSVAFAKEMLDSGDGERAKKARVVDESGKIIWPR